MRVKVNDAHRAISTVDRPQQRQSDGMITAKGDDTGQGLAVLSRALLLGIRPGLTGEDAVVSLLDLVKGIGVVVRGNRDITAVEDGGPAVEGVGLEGHVVAAVQVETAGALTDTRGAEASAGTVRCAGVEGGTW
jgi:hypothetical protein